MAAYPTADSAPSLAVGRRCCLGHQPSPVQCPHFHAGQRACTLPASDAGPAGTPPAGPLGSAPGQSPCPGPPGRGVPAAALKFQRPDDLVCLVQRQRSAARFAGAVGSAIAVSLCLRAGDGVPTFCGLPVPVEVRFAARAVGVAACGWESLTAALHGTLLRAGAKHWSPGPAGCLALAQGDPRASGAPAGTPCSRRCEGRLPSGALPPPASHLWGGQPGLVAHVCARWEGLRGWLPPGGV